MSRSCSFFVHGGRFNRREPAGSDIRVGRISAPIRKNGSGESCEHSVSSGRSLASNRRRRRRAQHHLKFSPSAYASTLQVFAERNWEFCSADDFLAHSRKFPISILPSIIVAMRTNMISAATITRADGWNLLRSPSRRLLRALFRRLVCSPTASQLLSAAFDAAAGD